MLAFALFGLILCFLPPTQLLGYEFAWGTVLFATFVGAWLIRREHWPRALIAFAAPLLLGLLNALRVRNCNLGAGIEWYVVLALPELLLTWQLAQALAKIRYGAVYYYALVALAVTRVLLGLYQGPQMRFYDPLLGFFAGSIYDEALPIPRPLLWHPLMVSLFALSLFRQRVRFAILATIIFAFGASLDFRTPRSKLAEELSASIVTPHVIIHFAPAGTAAKALPQLWPEIERRAEAAAQALGVTTKKETHLYLYDDMNQKERLMGARQTLFTRPWIPEIHYLYSADLRSLEHELLHTTAASWNDSLLAVPSRFFLPHMASVEGLAVALSDEDETPPIVALAALEKMHHAPDVGEVFSPLGFYRDSGERAYLAAGAYTSWFLQTRGREALKVAYAGAGLSPTPGDLGDFHQALAATPSDDLSERYFAAQFQERPLYARVCGREQAERLTAAQAAVSQQRFADADALCSEMLKDDPTNLQAELIKLDTEKKQNPQVYAAHVQALLARTDLPPHVALSLEEQNGDFSKALAFAVRRDDERRLRVKLLLSARPDAATLLHSLDTDNTQALSILADAFHASPADALIGYLYARRLAASGDSVRAFEHLPAARAVPDFLAFETARLFLDWSIDLRLRSGLAEAAQALTERASSPRERALAARTRARADFYLAHEAW